MASTILSLLVARLDYACLQTVQIRSRRFHWLCLLSLLCIVLTIDRGQAAPLSTTQVSGVIITNTTWNLAGSPYILLDDVIVGSGVTLRIDPGVVVLGSANSHDLIVEGTLLAVGTFVQPITFSAVSGNWGGIRLQGGTATFDYVEVSKSAGYGIFVNNQSNNLLTVTNSRIYDNNSYPILLFPQALSGLTVANNNFTGNGANQNRIAIAGGSLSANATLQPVHGGEYELVGDFTVSGDKTLTIQPAAVLRGAASSYRLIVHGTLLANGTAAQPIQLTSTIPGVGNWGGIMIQNGSANLKHVQLSNGVYGISLQGGRATVDQVDLSYSSGYGIFMDIQASNWLTVTNSHFHDNTSYPLLVYPTVLHQLRTANNTYTANGSNQNRIGIVSGSLTANTSLQPAHGGEYELLDDLVIPSEKTLTIQPAAVLRGATAATDLIVNGTLQANGTATQPITLTAVSTNWGGVSVQGGPATLNYVHLSKSNGHGISVAINATNMVTVTNSRFYNNNSYPILVYAASLHQLSVANNTFTGNGSNQNRIALVGGSMTANATLMAAHGGEYELQSDFTIPSGKTLTMQPAAILRGNAAPYGLIVAGALIANGTATQPITLTSVTEGAGNWSGIEVQGGAVTLQRAHLSNSTNGISLQEGIVTINRVDLSNSSGYGILVGTSVNNRLTVNNSRFQNNASYPIMIYPSALHRLTVANNSYTGNSSGLNRIGIIGGSLAANTVLLPAHGGEYELIDDLVVPSGTTLTMRPATILRGSVPSSNLIVEGRLLASGTVTQPITMTAVSGAWGGITVQGGNATLNYVDLNKSAGYGIFISSHTTSQLRVSNSHLHDNGSYPILLYPASLHQLSVANNRYTNNGSNQNRIGIAGGALTANATLQPAHGGEYELTGTVTVPNGTKLTLQPTAILLGGAPSYYLTVEGTLLAIGTATQPITFTAVSGTWGGISLQGGNIALDYVDLSKSAGYGILVYTSNQLRVNNSHIHDNVSYPILLYPAALHQLSVANNRYTNNGDNQNRIGIAGGALAANATLQPAHGGEYELASDLVVPANVRLTLQAGSILRGSHFMHGLTIQGHLQIDGTTEQPVLLSAVTSNPGSWEGLSFTTGATASFNGCIIEYATTGLLAGVPLDLFQCTLRNNLGGLFVTNWARVTLVNSTVMDNSSYGVQNITPAIAVDARNTWWGVATGPFHATLNPAGAGNQVTDGVLFTPWRTNADVTTAVITIIKDAMPNSATNFRFTGGLGSFYLDDILPQDADAYTSQARFVVAPGVYNITEVLPSTWVLADVRCNPAANSAVNLALRRVTLTVAAGTNVICTFTNHYKATMNTLVFHDLNQNRLYNAGEPGLLGWTVRIYDSNNTQLFTGTTDTAGKANVVRQLPPNVTYKVCVDVAVGWTRTVPTTFDPVLSKPCYSTTPTPGQTLTLRFGNKPLAVGAAAEEEVTEVVEDVTLEEAPELAPDESGYDADYVEEEETTPPTDQPAQTQSVFLPLVSTTP